MEKSSYETIPILGEKKWQTGYGTATEVKFYQSVNIGRSKRLTYPKAVLFVLLSKFFEAYAVNGVRTVLALYLRDSLNFSEEAAMTSFHAFNFFTQFSPIFGAIVADSYLGNVRTIFYSYFLYAIGWIGMVILTLPFNSVPIWLLLISSILLIAIGNGTLRTCVTALGGEQFELPEQSDGLNQYFSHYYFVYTLGILLSKIIPPEIRAQTKCFGEDECYAAVFGSLAIVFLFSWIIFLLGLFLYKSDKITGEKSNILFQVIGCIYHAMKAKFAKRRRRISFSNQRWINASTEKYPDNFVEDVYCVLKVLKLFSPFAIYWALYVQIDSSWTFQASKMNTTVLGYHFQADQVKSVGALLLLCLIPLWQNVIIPALMLCNIQISPLKSMTMGGISAALSYVCAAILELNIHNDTDQKISVAWQMPQFFLIMLAEVWLSIPSLTFSFTQAPPTMKSVLTAAWFVNGAFGNLIVIAITEAHPFDEQSSEYLLYAVLMAIAIMLFGWMAKNYRYTDYDELPDQNVNANGKRPSNNQLSYSAFSSQDGLDIIF